MLDRSYRSTRQIAGAAAVSVIGDGRELNAVRGEGVTAQTAFRIGRDGGGYRGGPGDQPDDGRRGYASGRRGRRAADSWERKGDRSLSDFAVLFRTGRQAEAIEHCFIEEGLPYRVVGQKGFLSAGNVRHAISFFNYAFRPAGHLCACCARWRFQSSIPETQRSIGSGGRGWRPVGGQFAVSQVSR